MNRMFADCAAGKDAFVISSTSSSFWGAWGRVLSLFADSLSPLVHSVLDIIRRLVDSQRDI